MKRLEDTAFWKRFMRGPSWGAFRKNAMTGRYVSPTLQFIRWLDAMADIFFTPQGRILFIACIPLILYSMMLTRTPAIVLFLLMFIIFFIDGVRKLFVPFKLKAERRPPPRVVCGIPFEIKTEVTNSSALPVYDLACDSSLRTPEMKPADERTPVVQLPAGTSAELRRAYTITKRGVYHLPPCVIESDFPFALIKARRRRGAAQEIICHPAHAQLRTLKLPDGGGISEQSVNSIPAAGNSLDLHGCREYRSGDDPRKIHWNASAKHNKLVVKEFQEEKLSRAAIVLDNRCPPLKQSFMTVLKNIFMLKPILKDSGRDKPFEAAVSLTASVAESLASGNFVIDVFAAGSEIHHFRTGRNTMTTDAFLDILAALEYTDCADRFKKLSPEILSMIASTGAVFLILTSIDPESEKIYKALVSRTSAIRVFLVSGTKGPAWTESVSPDGILKGNCGDL